MIARHSPRPLITRWLFISMMVLVLLIACGVDNEEIVTPEVTEQETSTGDNPDMEATVAAAVQSTVEAQSAAATNEPDATAPPEATATNTVVPATMTPSSTNTPQPDPTAIPRPELTIGPGGGPQYDDGHYVTIHAIEDPTSVLPSYYTPEPGNRSISLDIELCGGTEDVAANPNFFTLQMPDNTRIDYSSGYREPVLAHVDLYGDCVRGWVSFELPEGQNPTYIVYTNYGYQPAKFVWPE